MLDGGPSRKFRTVERTATERPVAARRQSEEMPQMVEAAPVHGTQEPQPTYQYRGRPQRLNVIIVVIAIVVAMAAIGWALWLKPSSTQGGSAIEKDKLQAVFMVGGQVYFGKLEVLDGSYMKLSQVFYVQSGSTSTNGDSENPQTATADSSMQLIKLGEEVHGPEDAMIINRDQMLFYENLKPSGKVSQLIQNYKSGKQ